MATAHIDAKSKSLIAEVVLMPGDPLRAKYIADTYLSDVIKINQARGMLGFTGYYNGKRITVMGSGMGMPSMGIYSYELFKFYDVKTIIRIGTAGAYSADLNLFDVLLAKDAYSESTFASVMGLSDSNILAGSSDLNALIMKTAQELEIDVNECRIHSSDVFYTLRPDFYKEVRDNYGCQAVEMETFALYANAMALNRKAATILTVSNSFETKEEMSSLERQNSLNEMMKLALEVAIRC
ncbi:MAG: purine-nucleoside phosphorylase [bacterium]|nr:purine-nucleoside phosphorylase [bacterium]